MIPMFDYYKERHNLHSTDDIKPGLLAIEHAMELLGQPQNDVPMVHVAGTNGKGSTIKMLERLLQEHGLKTATFMSPCIEDVHDQIQFEGQPITEQQMDEAFKEAVDKGLDNLLTDFELLTAIAFIAIKQQKPDIAIIESGMGGRFDSTNVIDPLVSIIPSIALEHTNYLGNTIEEIAGHKAGIIKKERPIVIGKLPLEAEVVMKQEAAQQKAPLFIYEQDFRITDKTCWRNKQVVYRDLKPSLKGNHQLGNMALAIEALVLVAPQFNLQLNEDKIRQAVATTVLAGRFENIAPNVWLDGAHNPASVKMLRQMIEQQFPQEKITVILGILKDKDVESVLRELEKVSDDFVFVEVESEQHRLMPSTELLALSQASNKQTSDSVLQHVREKAKHSVVIVTGSLYLLAQWRKVLLQNL